MAACFSRTRANIGIEECRWVGRSDHMARPISGWPGPAGSDLSWKKMRSAAFLGSAVFVALAIAACGIDAVGLLEGEAPGVDGGSDSPFVPIDGSANDG